MAEKPILFSGPMVRAILDGRKSVTRRIVKLNESGRVQRGGKQWHVDDPNAAFACPYGRRSFTESYVRLWVRETWSTFFKRHPGATGIGAGCVYRADVGTHRINQGSLDDVQWRPSIFMPRWASRITLRVTDVRIERLQEISEVDAIAEGVIQHLETGRFTFDRKWRTTARLAFAEFWDQLHNKSDDENGAPHSWDANPYVWLIEFERVEAKA